MRALVWCAVALILLSGCTQPRADDEEAAPDAVVRAPTFGGVAPPNGTARLLPFESFEPTLGVDADGTLFMSTFQPAPPERVFFRLVARSDDQGLSWTDVTPALGPVGLPPQSNDPYVFVDVATGRVFSFDLQATVCSTLSWSDDKGATWTSQPVACGAPAGGQDHQSLFAAASRGLPTQGYPHLLHQCVNRVVDAACAVSVDGGLTWGPLRPLVYTGVAPEHGEVNTTAPPFSVTRGATQVVCGGLSGHGAADSEGRIFLPKGHCGVPMVAWSDDDGITWTQSVIDAVHPLARGTIGVPGGEGIVTAGGEHEVALAVDEADNLFAFWVAADGRPYLSYSVDHGVTWSEGVDVAPPEVTVTTFPTIAAGAEGRVAAVYYGSTSTTAPQQMTQADVWSAYMTVLLNATTPTPEVATVVLHDPDDPVARGVCAGSRCGTHHPEGIGEVGDFIDVVIDGAGRPWAALVDVCLAECAAGPAYAPASAGFVGTLDQGVALRGPLGPLPPLSS